MQQDHTARTERAEAPRDADAALLAVRKVCDRHERGALRWADPLPVPGWIAEIRAALGDA